MYFNIQFYEQFHMTQQIHHDLFKFSKYQTKPNYNILFHIIRDGCHQWSRNCLPSGAPEFTPAFQVRGIQSLALCACFVDRCLYFFICVVCPSFICGFCLPLWYLQTLLTPYKNNKFKRIHWWKGNTSNHFSTRMNYDGKIKCKYSNIKLRLN